MLPYTRREFAKLALAAIPAAGALSALGHAAEKSAAPKARGAGKVNGVVIGLNVPYSFSMPAMSSDEILERCVQLGVGGVEMRTQPVEAFLGAPANLVGTRATVAVGGAAESNAQRLRQWRESVAVDRAGALRQQYEAAGVMIEIVKVDGIFKMSDAELDYVFNLGKALGARALSTEISRAADADRDHARVGSFADKHKFWIGYHGHTKTGPEDWEKAFALAKYNAANVDLGHFVSGWSTSPIPFLKQHHARITHVHVKDRKMHEGPNTPFGEGDTPIVEALRLIRDNHWPIQATIEFEYKVPADSDRMKEIAKCVQYCRDALA